ncbi:MAG: 30S ribosomal protein S16 [Minisyncoccia bacterium]
MLMIRLQRIGRKNDPAFRILVLEKTRSPKAGTYTDLLGTYNPKTKAFTIAADRLKDWMGKGAQVSPSLMNLLIDKGILEGKKVNVLPKKSPPKKEEVAAEAPAAAATPEAVPAAEVLTEETPVSEPAPVEPVAEEVAVADEAAAKTEAEVPAETPVA